MTGLRFLLLQCRKANDPVLQHELDCFAQALQVPTANITTVNIVFERPAATLLNECDVVLVGGAGDFSVLEDAPFLLPFFDFFREIDARAKPMFASCFGFQAICIALDGDVISDEANSEVGTCRMHLTVAGKADPVFGDMPSEFYAQVGHKDRASLLPKSAVNLARSDNLCFEAMKIRSKPIYATQFHPELTMTQNRLRFETYIDSYSNEGDAALIAAVRSSFRETPAAYRLLRTFVEKTVKA